jgi:hypothetical protein
MQRAFAALGLSATLLLAGCGKTVEYGPAGDKEYKLVLRDPAPNEARQVNQTTDGQTTFTLKGPKGPFPAKQEGKTETVSYVETILEQPPGAKKPTRLRRQYSQAQTRVGKATTNRPYWNRVVLIEKKDERYTFRVEGGGPLTGLNAKDLEQEFNRKGRGLTSRDFLPSKPVKVGESWTINLASLAEPLQATFQLKYDVARSTATGKLTRVHHKDKQLRGTLEIRLDLALTAAGDGVPLLPDSRLEITSRPDLCIDGSSADAESSDEIKVRVVRAAPPQGTLVIESNVKLRVTDKARPK